MPYQPQPPMDANNTPGLAPRAQLPQNIEAEQSVLAACLLNGEVTEEAVMRLRPENFFRPAHRIIFEAIISLTNRHIPVDPIALADTLKSTGQLEAVGGRAFLAELADNTERPGVSSMNMSSWESLPEASAKAPQSPSAINPLRSFERFTRASEHRIR